MSASASTPTKAWTKARSASPRPMPRGVSLLPAMLVLLSGCASLWPSPYGELAADADPVRPDGRPNTIPANAPSTLNGYWADYDGHQGIDVLGAIGTPVLAPAPGVVTASYFEPMYGHRVVIDHGTAADGAAMQSLLVHLDQRLVEVGDRVRRGQQIGALGRTGLLAAAIPHLHFEIGRRAPGRFQIHRPENPHRYWIDGPGIVTCFDKSRDYPALPFRTTYPVPCRGVAWQ